MYANLCVIWMFINTVTIYTFPFIVYRYIVPLVTDYPNTYLHEQIVAVST